MTGQNDDPEFPLMACPFCGCDVYFESRPDKGARNWKIVCPNTQCFNYATVGWARKVGAVEAWNKRAGDSRKRRNIR